MTRPNHAIRQRHRRQGGFTLIELLVVIAILAVLAAIVVFNVSGVTNRGNKSACETDVQTVQAALDAYRADNTKRDGSPANAPGNIPWNSLVPDYLHTRPTACLSYGIDNGTVSGTPR